MKSHLFRILVFPMFLGMAQGCGGPTWDPGSVKGSFARIEAAVEDISSQLAPAKKKGAMEDLGSDSDRIGFSLSTFMKATEGTPLQEDAKDFEKKFTDLETLVSTRAPMPKLEEALKQVQDSLATIKSKL